MIRPERRYPHIPGGPGAIGSRAEDVHSYLIGGIPRPAEAESPSSADASKPTCMGTERAHGACVRARSARRSSRARSTHGVVRRWPGSGKKRLAHATAASRSRLRPRRSLPRCRRGPEDVVGPPAAVESNTLHTPRRPQSIALATRRARVRSGRPSPRARAAARVGALVRLQQGRAEGADLIVVDTSAMVSALWGQLVKSPEVDTARARSRRGTAAGGGARTRAAGDPALLRGRARTLPVHPKVVPTASTAGPSSVSGHGRLLRRRAATLSRETRRAHARPAALFDLP